MKKIIYLAGFLIPLGLFATNAATTIAEKVLTSDDETTSELYPINFDKDEVITHSSRYTSSIGLSGDDGDQSIDVNQEDTRLLYTPLMEDSFKAVPGETVSATFTGSMSWMAGYVYIDLDNDGNFDVEYDDDDVTDMLDLMTYSQYQGVDSDGNTISGAPTLNPPSFTIPEDLEPGIYRIRYKIDWNCVDPGGNDASDNLITTNGGVIVDTRINIHGTTATITDKTSENGSITLADGTALESQSVTFGEDLDLLTVPDDGYTIASLTIRHGYNLDGDSLVNENPQWVEDTIDLSSISNNEFTLDGDYIDGDVILTATFKKLLTNDFEDKEEYGLNFDESLELSDPTNNVLSYLKITSSSDGNTTIKIGNSSSTTVYRNLLPKQIHVIQGGTLTITPTYTGGDVNAYFYLDQDNDGIFSVERYEDGSLAGSSDLLAYSYYEGYNSEGTAIAEEDADYTLPTINIPSTLDVGIYRARVKYDVNNLDPAGTYSEGGENLINETGGYIIDFLVNVHEEEVDLDIQSENGAVIGKSNTGLPETITFGSTYTVQFLAPVDGFAVDSVIVRHGYNLDDDQYIHGNPQWSEYKVSTATAGRTYTLPADSVNGTVRISAYFSGDGTEEYELYFADEFNKKDTARPSSTYWETPDRLSSAWNRFIAISSEGQRETAHIENGKLVCRCMPNTFDDEGSVDMVSGAVRSMSKVYFTYGKVEARIQTTGYSGNFPAFWMMPQDNSAGWPNAGEIDIWEQINAEDVAYHTIHSNWSYNLGNTSNPKSSGSVSCTTGEYHIFSLLWEEDLLTWYVDGAQSFSYAKSTDESTLENGQWPFDADFYIILNQSVGNGSWASSPDTSHTYETKFDWVRVYQLKEEDDSEDTDTSIQTVEQSAADRLSFYSAKGTLRLVAPQEVNVSIYDLSGRLVFNQTVQGNQNVSLPTGVYILNGKKVLVP